MFEILIDSEKAFDLEVPNGSIDSQESIDFYNVLKNNPTVEVVHAQDVRVGDAFMVGVFYRDGQILPFYELPIDSTLFAFINNGLVIFTQTIQNTVEMLVAAYSSSPVFNEVVQ